MSANKIVHRPNVFPERALGPMGVDIQGEQFINTDDGRKRVYFYKFWGGANGLASQMVAYFPYKEDGTLDETESVKMKINEALTSLGVTTLKPESKFRKIILPDMDRRSGGNKKVTKVSPMAMPKKKKVIKKKKKVTKKAVKKKVVTKKKGK